MATAAGISIDEYLRSDYEPDCDYVDGHLEDRNVGQRDHSYSETAVGACLFALRQLFGGHVFTEQRLRVSETRIYIPDVCVVLGAYPKETVFDQPPFLCIEILSPDDRIVRMQRKIRDYLNFGVKFVWLIDPADRRAWIHSGGEIREVIDGVLRTSDPDIVVTLSEVLPE